MLRIRVLLGALLACSALAAAAVDAAPALASHNQTVFFEAGQVLLEPRTREHAIAQLEHLGVHALRVELYWSDVAPGAGSSDAPEVRSDEPRGVPLGSPTTGC